MSVNMGYLKYLSDADVEAIHQTSLQILSEIGIILTHPEAIEILSGAGATVKKDRVFLPPDLVEREVKRCPNQIELVGRNKKKVILGNGSLNFHNTGGAREVYDPVNNIRRPAVLQDVRDSTKLLDALENCTVITPFFTPQDVPGELMALAMYRNAIPYTTKPVDGPGVLTVDEVDFMFKMAEVVGDKTFSLSLSPISPLRFSDALTSAMMAAARKGIFVSPLPCPTGGATAPFTVAGGLSQQNAEVLAGIVLIQLVNPGLPVEYNGRLAMMDPKTAMVSSGIIDAIIAAGTVQIGHYYKLPVDVYGFSSASHMADIQMGFERSHIASIPALAGADILSGIGEIECGVGGSYTQMVSDNELATGIHRLRAGIKIDKDSLGMEVIREAANGNQNYLDKKHTVKYLRGGERPEMPLSETRMLDIWEKEGRQGMNERASAKAKQLLAEHEVPPLSNDQEKALDEIMKAAENKLVSK
jgi:trimethylamine---corrinoid protein Co-methyltransferase